MQLAYEAPQPVQVISDKQVGEIRGILEKYDWSEPDLVKAMKIETLEEMPEKRFQAAMNKLKAKALASE